MITLHTLKNQVGSSMVGAVVIMLILGLTGAAVIQMTTGEHAASTNDLQEKKALLIGDTGLEYAKSKLHSGYSPNVANKSFDGGSFTITSNPDDGLVTVNSTYGIAHKTQTINSEFGKHCTEFDTSHAYSNKRNLCGIRLVKTCNNNNIVDKLWIDWNWSSCALTSADPFTQCSQNAATYVHNDAYVELVSIDDTLLYNPNNGNGHGSGNGQPNTMLDLDDLVLSGTGTHLMEGPPQCIRFSQDHPGQGLYYLTMAFKDGSEITTKFRDPTSPPKPTFTVDTGKIVTQPDQVLALDVLCSEITYGVGGPEVDVTVELGTKGNGNNYTWTSLFSGRDVDGGEHYSTNTGVGKTYKVRARAKYRTNLDVTYDSANTLQFKTLTNGQAAPPLQGFGGQKPVTACLQHYLNAQGKVVLQSNQALLLVELGVNMANDPHSTAADFQDLVALVTFTPPASANTSAPTNNGGAQYINLNMENLLIQDDK